MLYESIQLDPEGFPQNYMQLGELVSGKQSIECYQKGLEILLKRVNHIDYDVDEVKKDIALAYSALAEVYQTDLVQEKTSEARCYQNILSALEYDPLCLDAYVQFVNYFINKGDMPTAKKIMKKVMEEIHLEMDNETIFDEEESQGEAIPYSLRINVAKLLIEFEDWEEGHYILNGLYEEDNSNLDVIYMLAFVNFKLQRFS